MGASQRENRPDLVLGTLSGICPGGLYCRGGTLESTRLRRGRLLPALRLPPWCGLFSQPRLRSTADPAACSGAPNLTRSATTTGLASRSWEFQMKSMAVTSPPRGARGGCPPSTPRRGAGSCSECPAEAPHHQPEFPLTATCPGTTRRLRELYTQRKRGRRAPGRLQAHAG